MKKLLILITLVLAFAGLLSGCAASQTGSAAGGSESGAPEGTPAPGQPGSPGGLPQAMRLAIGTLKLEGTENAVTAEQAAQLLPLWKAVRSLSGSDSAAADEIRGLFNQIEKAMSAEQLAGMDAMGVGIQDLSALTEQFGIEIGPQGGGPQGTPDPGMQATMEAMRATRQAGGETGGGGFGGPPPGGGFGGPPPGGGLGGPGMGGSDGLSEEARATLVAQRGGRGARIGVPSGLTDAIIKLLEARAAE